MACRLKQENAYYTSDADKPLRSALVIGVSIDFSGISLNFDNECGIWWENAINEPDRFTTSCSFGVGGDHQHLPSKRIIFPQTKFPI